MIETYVAMSRDIATWVWSVSSVSGATRMNWRCLHAWSGRLCYFGAHFSWWHGHDSNFQNNHTHTHTWMGNMSKEINMLVWSVWTCGFLGSTLVQMPGVWQPFRELSQIRWSNNMLQLCMFFVLFLDAFSSVIYFFNALGRTTFLKQSHTHSMDEQHVPG